MRALCRLLLSRLPALNHVPAASGVSVVIYGRKPNQWNTLSSTALQIHIAGNAVLAKGCAILIDMALVKSAPVRSLWPLTTS